MALAQKTRKKPPLAHKKRVGQHHKQGKHYLKHYWPYIPMLLIVGVGLLVNSIWSSQAVLGAKSDYSAQALLDATNRNRSNDSKPVLELNRQLTAAAQIKANDMATRNYWSHTAPDGKTPWDLITTAGYQYEQAGENLAYGFRDAVSTEAGWMNSSEHRTNILNAAYTQVGFAVASAPNYQGKGPSTIVVAEYATPAPAAANITFVVPEPSGTVAGVAQVNTQEIHSKKVSRIQLMTGGNASWSLVLVSIIASSALTAFLLRHGMRLHKLLANGEHFVARHGLIDAAFLVVVMAGYVLIQTSGVIR